MKIRRITLKNFKRFTDTTVGEIPAEARLVVLIGPNGSGKSSLIEAVHYWHRNNWAQTGGVWHNTYHAKQLDGAEPPMHPNNDLVSVAFHDPQPIDPTTRQKAVYVRTAYRNEPAFTLDNLSRVVPALQEGRISRLIENDQAVSTNYRRLVSEGLEYVYEGGDGAQTLHQFRERSIGAIRDAMNRLFPGLLLNSLGNPLENGTFRFDKGDSRKFQYMNLSGGEKAAFDLLLDVLIKRREFDDTVFFIDEPEAHMSVSLQGALLAELFTLVPDNSQLWIATHSLGMMRRARELERANPGSVLFVDFDASDFDVTVEVKPVSPDRAFWKRAMQVAVDDLAGYVSPEKVVLCEGTCVAGGSDFDAGCYNQIFGAEFPEVLFIGAGNVHDVENDPRGVTSMIRALSPATTVLRLVDRDDRRDDEIPHARANGVRVLSLRNIESYLLDDEVLNAVCHSLGHPEHFAELSRCKTEALDASIRAGGPADDLKRVAGDIFNGAKRLFVGQRLGKDARSFMSGICALQIRAGTGVYTTLRNDVFG